jgi:hypothetical protein
MPRPLSFLFLIFVVYFPQSVAAFPQPLYMDYLLHGPGIDPSWSRLSRPALYLLAWSSSGRTLTAQADSAGKKVEFLVWETIDDQALARVELPGWEGGSESLWWKENADFLNQLKKKWDLHACDYQLGNFPLIDPNDVYFRASLQLDRPFGSVWGTHLRLLIHGGGLGTKIVLDRFGLWRRALLIGFVPSPFEDRLLIIVAVQPTGWQGSETPIQFLLVGASLVVGFGS